MHVDSDVSLRVNTLFKSLGAYPQPQCYVKHLLICIYLLGCIVSKLTLRDLAQLGLPDTAGETKRAVLKCPVKFPQSRIKRAVR